MEKELIGNTISSVMVDVLKDVASGKLSAQDLEKLSKQFSNENRKYL